MTRHPKRWLLLALLGVLLALGPLWGFVGTVIGLLVAFGDVAAVPAEHKAPVLAHGIEIAMRGTLAGLCACPLGILLLGWVAWASLRRPATTPPAAPAPPSATPPGSR